MTAGADSPLLVHGACVTLSDRGALLRGKPGSGKSDLALRFISRYGGDDLESGARLVSDDQVLLSREGEDILACPPEAIAGKLEVRGVGIVEVAYCTSVSLALIVDMARADDVPRLPPEPLPVEDVLGVPVPVLRIDPFELSSPIKLKLALTGAV